MDRDWKTAFAAQRRDAMSGEAAWRPMRQLAVAGEPRDGWWWKLALAMLPSIIGAGLLWRAAERPPVAASIQPQRIEVVFLPPDEPPAEVPSPPEPPATLRSARMMRAVPVPPALSVSALPDLRDPQPQPQGDDALPPPSAGDLLRQLEFNAARRYDIDGRRIPRHLRPRLPGRAEAFVEGIHVRGRPSPQQRVQFVLGLVGLGQRDPCPDIQRHVRDAIIAEQSGRAVGGELVHWLTRAERCPRR